MARLDSLGPAKEVAQIAAAIGREFSSALLVAVAQEAKNDLEAALDRLVEAGLLFRQGLSPHANYLFKHALIQDAAYSTLLREPRRVLHARIAEALENQFPDVAESQPELVARHCTEAGLNEKATALWGKAGQRSLEHSALIEAAEQLSRALEQIGKLPMTAKLRRDQIKLQVEVIGPLLHVKGYAAPETKAPAEQARFLIEQAEQLGEPLEDPLLLFSVLYSFWIANLVSFNGDAMRELASQFLTLAKRNGTSGPLMIGHRLVGLSLVHAGETAKGRAHLDRAITFYDANEHRSLATRFGQDLRVAILSFRSVTLWLLGYADAAVHDANGATEFAHESGQAAALMYALLFSSFTHWHRGSYTIAKTQLNELTELADEKGALFWKAWATMQQGGVLSASGKFSDAIHAINSGVALWRSTGSTFCLPLYLSNLANAYADVGHRDEAWRCIVDAKRSVGTTKEALFEAEVSRVAGGNRFAIAQS